MIRSALAAIVLLNTGRTDKTTLVDTALNLGLLHITRMHDFRSLKTVRQLTVVAGNDSKDTAMSKILGVVVQDSSPTVLTVKSKTWCERNIMSLKNTTGRPTYGYVLGPTLWFFPVADTGYTLEVTGVINPSMDTASTENPLAGSDEFLIAFATAYIYKSVEMFDAASYWGSEANRLAAGVIAFDNRTQVTQFGGDPLPQPTTATPWLDPFVGVDE